MAKDIKGITVNFDVDNAAIKERDKKRAKKALREKMARELLEQCAGQGFTYLDVKEICRLVLMDARNQAFIRPHVAGS